MKKSKKKKIKAVTHSLWVYLNGNMKCAVPITVGDWSHIQLVARKDKP